MESKVIPLRAPVERKGLARIAGLDSVVHRLRSTVVTPVRVAELGDPAVTAPRGIVMYGPPGCGKAHIVSALAEELGLAEVSVAFTRLGEEPLSGRSLVVIGDAVSDTDGHLLAEWFDRPDPDAVLSVVITDRPWELAPELLAIGRFDRMVLVPPPDFEARRLYVRRAVRRVGLAEDEDLEEVIASLEGGTGADIDAVFDAAAALMANGPDGERPPDLGAIRAASMAHRTDARRWLEEARSLVAMTATRGLVDDLVAYLRRHRLI